MPLCCWNCIEVEKLLQSYFLYGCLVIKFLSNVPLPFNNSELISTIMLYLMTWHHN